MGITTSMAPLKICRLGWISTYQIFPANYGSHFESWLRHISQGTDYARVSEATGLKPRRECHIKLLYVLPSPSSLSERSKNPLSCNGTTGN